MKEDLIKKLKSDIVDAWVKGSKVWFSIIGAELKLSTECEIDIVRDEETIFIQGEGFSIELSESEINSIYYDGTEGKCYEIDGNSGVSYIYEFPEEDE